MRRIGSSPTGWLTGTMTRHAWKLSAVWMVAFAAIHLYWGLGGSALLPVGKSVVDNATLLVIDLVAIPLCLAGAATAWLLRPGQRLGKLHSRRWLLLPATLGAAVMVSHALSGLVVLAAQGLSGFDAAGAEGRYVLLYEPFWLVGGVAMAWTVTAFRRTLRAQSLHRKSRAARTLPTAAQRPSTSQAPTRA